MKKLLNIFYAVSLALFIIGFSAIAVVSCKSIYYFDITYLDITSKINLSEDDIKKNYDYLIDYNLNSKVDNFELPSLPSSKEGAIHFKEVRDIFQNIIKGVLLFGVISIIGLILKVKNKDFRFLNITSISLILIPIIVSIPLLIDFNKCFILFHEIMFSNDYWIFDPYVDPVIVILPEEFFFHMGIIILGMVLVCSLILQILYRIMNKKINTKGLK